MNHSPDSPTTGPEAGLYTAGHVELLQRLTRMETKLDLVAETKDTANRADATSVAALAAAAENARDLAELKDSVTWWQRTTVLLGAGFIVNLVVNIVQGQ